jgi:hypothetical protein
VGTSVTFLRAFLDIEDLFVQQPVPVSRRGGNLPVQSES